MPVGPFPPPWPDDPRLDPELLEHGDGRNVLDRYRYWTVGAIVEDLATRRAGMHVGIENLVHDLNIGSIVRTANAFNAGGVHIVGRRRWNRRGAMVTDAYLDVTHHERPGELAAWARERDLPILAIDIVAEAEPLEGAILPERCLLLFGQEGPGLSADALGCADRVLAISQHGSTRSINVAAAAAIAMWAWSVQHRRFGTEPNG